MVLTMVVLISRGKTMTKYSKHGMKRIRKRVSVSKRQLQLVLERGRMAKEFKGTLKIYIDSVCTKNNTIGYVYGTHVYLFGQDDVFITVLNIPTKYHKQLRM